MLEKVREIAERYDALSESLSSAEVLADMQRFREISKERARIEEIALGYREYARLL